MTRFEFTHIKQHRTSFLIHFAPNYFDANAKRQDRDDPKITFFDSLETGISKGNCAPK
jgi:hypothetical protein